jgi:hypothetical protein
MFNIDGLSKCNFFYDCTFFKDAILEVQEEFSPLTYFAKRRASSLIRVSIV